MTRFFLFLAALNTSISAVSGYFNNQALPDSLQWLWWVIAAFWVGIAAWAAAYKEQAR